MSTTAQDDELNKILHPLFWHINGHEQMKEFTKSHELLFEYINQREHDAELRGRSSEIENILNSGMTARSTLVDRIAELKKLQGEK